MEALVQFILFDIDIILSILLLKSYVTTNDDIKKNLTLEYYAVTLECVRNAHRN